MAMRTIGLAAVNDIGDVSHVERSHPSVFPALGEDFQNLPEKWKKQLLDGIESLFRDGRRHDHDESQAIQAKLYEQIGRLKMEVEWLKKKSARFG